MTADIELRQVLREERIVVQLRCPEQGVWQDATLERDLRGLRQRPEPGKQVYILFCQGCTFSRTLTITVPSLMAISEGGR